MSEILKCDKMEDRNLKHLWAYIGLPYSGKTTIAKTREMPIVCPDTIRIALHGHKFIPEAEGIVWAIAKIMVMALFLSGHNDVILDATNGTVKRRKEWVSKKWVTYFVQIDTPKEECIKRATEAGDLEIIPIIEKMALEFEPYNKDE